MRQMKLTQLEQERQLDELEVLIESKQAEKTQRAIQAQIFRAERPLYNGQLRDRRLYSAQTKRESLNHRNDMI